SAFPGVAGPAARGESRFAPDQAALAAGKSPFARGKTHFTDGKTHPARGKSHFAGGKCHLAGNKTAFAAGKTHFAHGKVDSHIDKAAFAVDEGPSQRRKPSSLSKSFSAHCRRRSWRWLFAVNSCAERPRSGILTRPHHQA